MEQVVPTVICLCIYTTILQARNSLCSGIILCLQSKCIIITERKIQFEFAIQLQNLPTHRTLSVTIHKPTGHHRQVLSVRGAQSRSVHAAVALTIPAGRICTCKLTASPPTANKALKSPQGGIYKLKYPAVVPFLFQSIVTLSALKKLLLASADWGPPKLGYWYSLTKDGAPLLPGTYTATCNTARTWLRVTLWERRLYSILVQCTESTAIFSENQEKNWKQHQKYLRWLRSWR